MAQQVVAATPEVLDTLRKARVLVNQSNLGNQSLAGSTSPDNTISISNGTMIPARVKSGNGVNGYICDIHGNGLAESPTSEGIVYLTNGASTLYTLPVGTVIFVQAMQVSIMGSSD